QRHLPDPHNHPGLFLVGDYLFDSTINGTYDSADFVTDMLLTQLRKKKYAPAPAVNGHGTNGHANGAVLHAKAKRLSTGCVNEEYHDLYDGERSYEESFEEYFCEYYTTDLIKTIWGWSPPYKLLDCGSASGLTLERFANLGVEAWGVENSEYIHS